MNEIFNYLDELFPNPKCELKYNNGFEFLISVVLSAQTTDMKVNKVTEVLFTKYDIKSLKEAKIGELQEILKPLGMSNKKAIYIKSIAKEIDELYNGIIPNNREELMKLSGVGRKTANLVLATLYNKPYLAVDTHVLRVSKRLGFVDCNASTLQTELQLYKIIPNEKIPNIHHQLVLFGRYYCKSINPKCESCKIKKICKKNQL